MGERNELVIALEIQRFDDHVRESGIERIPCRSPVVADEHAQLGA